MYTTKIDWDYETGKRFKILLVNFVCLTTKTERREKNIWCEWQILPKTKIKND